MATQPKGTRLARRGFLLATGAGLAGAGCRAKQGDESVTTPSGCPGEPRRAAGAAQPGRVVLARAGSPERNARAALDGWGGAAQLVGPDDLVVIKVNAQWHSQGMSNTDVLAELVRAILERPGGFAGEVLLADNHHFTEPVARAWTTDKRNGRFNYDELVEHFRAAGAANVGKVHWHDAGPNPEPWQFPAGNGRRVSGPGEGDGYVWDLEDCHVTPEGNRCAMTWPVFSSPVSGDVVDLKRGVWRDGAFTGRPLRFWNVSSICHHSRYAGVTAAIKNLMGVVDMTCGFHGTEPPGWFNTHYVGMRPSHRTWRWAARQAGPVKRAFHALLPEEKALDFQHTGGALGHLMRTVRAPDLHLVTAEWIGWGSRTHPDMAARPGVVLAAREPVTLDAVAAREVLLPATRAAGAAGAPFLPYNDPDNADGPFHRFLLEAQREIGGRVDRAGAEVVVSGNG